MTVREAIDDALTECAAFFAASTAPIGIWIRRLRKREQELFQLAHTANPDYYLVCVTATLDASQGVDLLLMDGVAPNPPAADRIRRIEIADAGGSAYATGDRVTLVDIDDVEVAVAPRMVIRDTALHEVGTDLADVVSVKVFYSRRPVALAAVADETALHEPFDELLVWDLAKFIARRSPGAPQDSRAAAIQMFEAQEGPLLQSYLQHVAAYAPVASRFGG